MELYSFLVKLIIVFVLELIISAYLLSHDFDTLNHCCLVSVEVSSPTEARLLLQALTTISLLLGHYICDGVHPDDCSDEPTDRWLTFNDSAVTETTGASVCEQRQESAYILVYKRQARRQHCSHPALRSRRRGRV